MSATSWKIVMPKQKIKEGRGSLYLQIIINRVKKIKSLGISVKASDFDNKKQTVQIPLQEEKTNLINALIAEKINEVESRYYRAMLDKKQVSHEMLFAEKEANKANFLTYFGKKIKEDGVLVEKATVYKWTRTLALLRNFKKHIAFDEINIKLIENFNRYLNTLGIATNTIGKHHSFLRRFIYSAIKDGFLDKNPYQHFTIKYAKTVRIYLTETEISHLIKLYESQALHTQLQRTLRHFLFMFFAAGIRISDLLKLEKRNQKGDQLIIQPKKTKKTRVYLQIPLCGYAQKLIGESESRDEKLFYVINERKTNKRLKEIARIAQIDKNITCHVARHSFATCFLSRGGKVEVLQDLLGHSKIETTMIYVHIADDQKTKQIALLDSIRSIPAKFITVQL